VSVASFLSIKEDMRGSKIAIFSRLKEETNIDTRTAIVKRQKKEVNNIFQDERSGE
jgi:hypothetical protein